MDDYEVLGVSVTAPQSVIRAAYKARIRETHPDSGGNPADAQRVNDAYTVLNDPVRRAAYDRERQPSPPTTPGPSSATPSARETETARAPMPAEHVAYRGDINPPKRWWASIPLLVSTFVTLATAIVLFIMSTDMLIASLNIGTVILAVCVAIAGRSWKVYIGGFIAASAFAWFSESTTALGLGLVLIGVATAVAGRMATRREIRGWEAYAGDVVLTTANEQDGVELYTVERAQSMGERTEVLLTHVASGRQHSASLWGPATQGNFIALADGADMPLCEASSAGISRAIALRA